ncbi:MAG TPA: hypothetical protein VFZ49_01245 [Pyrinomonadaceae bacterium]
MTRKGYIPTMALMLTLTFGASIANAGIIVSERNGIIVSELESETTCSETTMGEKFEGLISGLSAFFRTGIIVSELTSECRGGIIVSEREGIIVSERTGIIVSE